MNTRIGKVKRIDRSRGCGLLAQHNGRNLVPFYQHDCRGRVVPDEGTSVSFVPGVDFKGNLRAYKIVPLRFNVDVKEGEA
jgi:hypothetical protein